MSNIVIVEPLSFSVVVSGGSGGQNLLTPSPKEIWVSNAIPGGDGAQMRLDLGGYRAADSFFLGATNMGYGSRLDVFAGDDATATTLVGSVTLQEFGELIQPVPCFLRIAAPVTSRFWRFVVTSPYPAGLSYVVRAGIAAIGLGFTPTWNQEWGGGRQVIDLSSVERLPDGGFGISEGEIKSAYQWTLGDLTDHEVRALYRLVRRRAESRPVIVWEGEEDAQDASAAVHYGLLTRLQPYERVEAGRTRWALTMEEWL